MAARDPLVTPEMIRAAKWAVRNVPPVAQHVGGSLRGIARLAEDYRRKHWGDDGEGSGVPFMGESSTADLSGGVAVMGELMAIEYLTTKGGEREPSIYRHDFTEPRLPYLCYAPDERNGKNAIVIVRGPSAYSVSDRGIIG